MNQKLLITIIIMVITASFSYSQKQLVPAPDLANVEYGEHERHVMDVWFAEKEKTTPLALFIHGGGFSAGSKERIKADELKGLLEAGISVAAINYRYKSIAPLPAAHNDAKQALQFIRSNAAKWSVSKNKIAVWGSSAGAQISMWLAFSDEMANTESSNPIESESTRVSCVATRGGQTTMESNFWFKHLSKYAPGSESAFISKDRLRTFGAETMEEADDVAKSISALSLVSADDPPIFMQYHMTPDATAPAIENKKKLRGWIVHHVDFGTALKEKTDELNVEAHLKYPGAVVKYKSIVEFFKHKLLEE